MSTKVLTRRARIVAFATIIAMARVAGAQHAPPIELTRLTHPVTIDGVLDDAGWKDVAPLPLSMYTPVFRGTPTQRTEIRVAYDGENLYAAAWCYDTDRRGIRVNSLYRDRWSGDDAVALYIDTFNDKQNAKWFGVTPSGMRFDQLVSDDGNTLNPSWDTFWDAKATITDAGWFVEIRIPFSSLGFRPDSAGRAVMGLTATRMISRLNERVTFPEIDSKFEFRRPSVAQDVVLHDVKSHAPVYVTPYVLGGAQRTVVSDGGSGFRVDNGTQRDAGLDVRYPVTGRLTLDATVNTDFAQVEADDEQINLDRFPLFFPERRRFFQEGSGIFDFTAGGGVRLFHSRRIGIADDGSTVPVLGGIRLVGRVGAWDTGILEMQTRAAGATPDENFGVLRLRRQVLNANSTAGMMLTTFSAGGHTNLGLGTDGNFHVHGDEYVGIKYIATTDNADGVKTDLWNSGLVDLRWERRTLRGLQFNVNATHGGKDFNPAIGFAQRQDFTQANLGGNWFFPTDKNTYFHSIYPGAIWFSTFRNASGVLESGTRAVWVEWDTKAGGGGWIEPKWFHENVADAFSIGSITIPAGVYDFADLQLQYSMAAGSRLRTDIDFRSGTYFDGTRTQVILTPTWHASPHLELGTDYQYTHLRFDSRGQHENVQLARIRVRTAIDAQKSGNAFVQYNSTTHRLDLNVRLRYAFAEGTDLWIVYNEGLDTDRTRDDLGVVSPQSLARTLIVKYTRTLTF